MILDWRLWAVALMVALKDVPFFRVRPELNNNHFPPENLPSSFSHIDFSFSWVSLGDWL